MPAPLHRLATYPADDLAAREVRRALRLDDPWMGFIAHLLRAALWVEGGELPMSAVDLEETTGAPRAEIERVLLELLGLGEARGFRFYRAANGALRSREVDERLAEEIAFRDRQVAAGRRSAAARRERFGTAAPGAAQRSDDAGAPVVPIGRSQR